MTTASSISGPNPQETILSYGKDISNTVADGAKSADANKPYLATVADKIADTMAAKGKLGAV